MKFLAYFTILLMLLSVAAARPYAIADDESVLTSFFDFAFSPKFIFGGTISDEGTVERGESVDSKLTLKFTKNTDATGNSNGYTYRVTLYWVAESSQATKKIGTFYFANPHKANDIVTINVRNLDTSLISDSWCNSGIKIGGQHDVYLNGAWVEDTMGSATWSGNPGGRFLTGSNFRLTCASEPNPCFRMLLTKECATNGIPVFTYQSLYKDANGNCGRENQYQQACRSDESCVQGTCAKTSVCTNGQKRCESNGQFSVTCQNGNWPTTAGSGRLVCLSGCNEQTGECIGESSKEPGSYQCSSDTQCYSNEFCNSGICDVRGSAPNQEQTESTPSTIDFKPVMPGFFSTNAGKVSVLLGALLAIGGTAYAMLRKPKRRSR